MATVAISEMSAARDDTKLLTFIIANTKTYVNDLVASYRGNGIFSDMDTIPDCVEAKAKGQQ